MWWKKTKVFSKQTLKDANLDPIPFVKERIRSDFARMVLGPLPIIQTDQADQIEFQADAIVLSLPQWQTVKSQLTAISETGSDAQQEVIAQLIHSIENE